MEREGEGILKTGNLALFIVELSSGLLSEEKSLGSVFTICIWLKLAKIAKIMYFNSYVVHLIFA